jgi:hypothetical protein
VIEGGEGRVQHHDDGDGVVDPDRGVEAEESESAGKVHLETGDEQDEDGHGLEPVPEALVGRVHVDGVAPLRESPPGTA